MKRLAQKIRIPRLIRDFTGFGHGPTSHQIDEVWIPPGEPEVNGQDVLEDLKLPKPDIAFQVGGFDVEVRPGFAGSEYGDSVEVCVLMHVIMKGEDRWVTVQASERILLPKAEGERRMVWKSAIHRLLMGLIGHEMNESLMFNGEFHIDPHPEKRPRQSARDMSTRLQDIPDDIVREIFKGWKKAE